MSALSHLHRTAAMLLLGAALCGCDGARYLNYAPQVRGNRVEADKLAELVVGTSTRGDVQALLGSPTTKAVFDDSTWLYLSEVTRPRIAATLRVLEQQVVAITFDAKGVVTEIQRKTDEDAIQVGMASGATKSPGTEATFMQQLFGNIGRFGPGLGGGSPGSSANY